MAYILVVDDEPGILNVLKNVLEAAGHTVLEAERGSDALAVLPPGGVDLTVTDLVMPDMDGFKLIPALLERFPNMKIVAMSGGCLESGPNEYLQKAMGLGATQAIAKPFMLRELVSHVNTLLSGE